MPHLTRASLLLALIVASSPSIARAQPPVEPPPELEAESDPPEPADAPDDATAPSESDPPETAGAPAPATTAPAPAPPAPAPAAPSALELGPLTIRPMLQARFRYEGRIDPYGNGVPAPDQHFLTQRVRLGLDARWESLRVFMQVQDVRNFGTFPGQDDGARFAMHQGYLEVGDGKSYFRLGRQEIAYGDERMIGPLDWQMAARSFDAARLHGRFGGVELDAFGAMVRPQATFTVTPPGGMPTTYDTRGDYLAAAQASFAPAPIFGLDAYVLYRHDGPIDTAPTRDRDIAAPGLRLTGTAFERLSWTGEAIAQFGKVGDEAHLAFGVAGDLRYAFAGASRTQVGLGGAYGSGGSDPTERLDGFDNFYPTNHKFYGYADLFNLQNLVDLHVGAMIRPTSIPLTLQLQAFYFAQQQTTAPWTNAGGAVLGVGGGGDRTLGMELDAVAVFKPLEQLAITAGYSLFVPGAAAERLGHDETQHWYFVMFGVDTP